MVSRECSFPYWNSKMKKSLWLLTENNSLSMYNYVYLDIYVYICIKIYGRRLVFMCINLFWYIRASQNGCSRQGPLGPSGPPPAPAGPSCAGCSEAFEVLQGGDSTAPLGNLCQSSIEWRGASWCLDRVWSSERLFKDLDQPHLTKTACISTSTLFLSWSCFLHIIINADISVYKLFLFGCSNQFPLLWIPGRVGSCFQTHIICQVLNCFPCFWMYLYKVF